MSPSHLPCNLNHLGRKQCRESIYLSQENAALSAVENRTDFLSGKTTAAAESSNLLFGHYNRVVICLYMDNPLKQKHIKVFRVSLMDHRIIQVCSIGSVLFSGFLCKCMEISAFFIQETKIPTRPFFFSFMIGLPHSTIVIYFFILALCFKLSAATYQDCIFPNIINKVDL